jgi:hypothetical protein
VYDRLLEICRGCGPVRVASLKTMITLSAPVIFGGVTTRKNATRVMLRLGSPARHPALAGTGWQTATTIAHEFVFADPAQLDDDFAVLVREAYELAARE